MSITEYGPVPVSRLRDEFDEILEVLEAGRRVMVSRYGEVVAVIEPRMVLSPLLLSEYTAPSGAPLASLSARLVNQVGASGLIGRVVDELEPCFVTSRGSLYGAAVSTRVAKDLDLLGPDAAKSLQGAVDQFMVEHPDATEADTAAYAEAVQGGQEWRFAVMSPKPHRWDTYKVKVEEAYQRARVTGIALDEASPSTWVPTAGGTHALVVRDADQLLGAASTGNVRAILDLARTLVGGGYDELAIAVFQEALYSSDGLSIVDYAGAHVRQPTKAWLTTNAAAPR